jgi:hypothetical protein
MGRVARKGGGRVDKINVVNGRGQIKVSRNKTRPPKKLGWRKVEEKD